MANDIRARILEKHMEYLAEKELLDAEKRIMILYQKRGRPAPEETVKRYAELGISCLNLEQELKDLENERLAHCILDH